MSKIEEKSTRAIGDLVSKIEALSGKTKQEFCKGLSDSEKKAYINYIADRDSELVECMFRCNEPAGGSVTLTYRAYPGDPTTSTFIDGQTYKIPLYLAKRMNNEFQGSGTWYPTHGYMLDAQGKPLVYTSKKNHRFGVTNTYLT